MDDDMRTPAKKKSPPSFVMETPKTPAWLKSLDNNIQNSTPPPVQEEETVVMKEAPTVVVKPVEKKVQPQKLVKKFSAKTGGPRRILRKKSPVSEEPPIKFAPLVSNDNELLTNDLVSSEEMGPPTSTFVTTRTRTNTKKMPPIHENSVDTVTMDTDGAISFPLAPNSTLASNQFPLATNSTLVCNKQPLATHQFPMATPSHPQTRNFSIEYHKSNHGNRLMQTPLGGGNYSFQHNTPHHNLATPHLSEEEIRENAFKRKIRFKHVKGQTYMVLKVLGEGGSGQVVQAVDENGDMRAIKHVRLKDLSPVVKDSFIREINFLAEFKNSPYIVHLHDFELTEKSLLMVLEFGETDASKLMRHGRLEPNEVLVYWKNMLRAINEVHKKGIIHQDIKPANFVLVKGKIKLIDFGIANKMPDQLINKDATSFLNEQQFGTINYMAPESLQPKGTGYKVGRKVDVWSAGCMLYYMMYGQTPFQKITNLQLKLQAITDANHSIDFRDYPNEFLRINVRRCLNRDPHIRPSIEDLLKYYP